MSNRQLEVVVLPANGADIYSIIDRATGIDVLFKSPWGWRDPATLETIGDSRRDWLARYPGGWQQLIPNAGAERECDGTHRGYHGEAAIVEWQVRAHARNAVRLTTGLHSAPLNLTRTLVLDGPTLHVHDTIANVGFEAVEVMWVQHPGFGAPFIDEHCYLDFGGHALVSDAEAPGTALDPDTTYDVSPGRTRPAGDRDLRSVPAPHDATSAFGCLTDFDSGWFSIASPTAGFGIRIDWDSSVFPYAWFWQECHASFDYPWFGKAYVVAIEPANIVPGEPSAGRADRGQSPRLPPGDRWVSHVTFTRTPLVQPPGQPGPDD
jgi:hypothetical protein